MTKFNLNIDGYTLEEAIKSFYDDNPFTKSLGMQIDEICGGDVTISLKIKHVHTNVYDIAHGGVLMTLADTAIGAACLSLNKRVVTLDLNINMLKAVAQGSTVTAKAHIIHNGRQTVVGECSIFDEKNNLCCQSRATMFVLGEFAK